MKKILMDLCLVATLCLAEAFAIERQDNKDISPGQRSRSEGDPFRPATGYPGMDFLRTELLAPTPERSGDCFRWEPITTEAVRIGGLFELAGRLAI